MATPPRNAQTRAKAINHDFSQAGYSKAFIDWWWNELVQEQLDGKTPRRAWNQQERDRVEDVARKFVAKVDEMRLWAQQAHAAIADQFILDRIANQRPTRELIGQWRTDRTTL
jgi:hypothetical protein